MQVSYPTLDQKIISLEELLRKRAQWSIASSQVVFTNGCFDILHRGHIHVLQSARSFGDKLVVGLNSDASVKRLKGEERPFNNEKDRAVLLAALSCVDAVVLFEEDTPIQLIKSLLPEVLVKGGDYRIEDIVGAAEVKSNGGQIVVVPFLDGYSTTAVLEGD